MTQFPVSTTNEQSIFAALELSKNSWLLAIRVPGRDNPSLHPIKGGDAEGLMAQLEAARDRVAKVTGRMPTTQKRDRIMLQHQCLVTQVQIAGDVGQQDRC